MNDATKDGAALRALKNGSFSDQATGKSTDSATGPTPILRDAIYTTRQAAALVQMHPKTLARKIRAGLIRAKGGKYRILGSELLKLA